MAFPQRSRPSLLVTAAWDGLKSASDSRLRRANRHLSYSFESTIRYNALFLATFAKLGLRNVDSGCYGTHTFLYIVETLPFHYLSIKAFFNNKYIYLNAHFRDLAEQFATTIISKKLSDILSCHNMDEHPSVRSIRYLDRRAHLAHSIFWVEETALDARGKTHVFYTWKVPVFHVSEEKIPTGIITLSLPFSQLPFNTSYVPFQISDKQWS